MAQNFRVLRIWVLGFALIGFRGRTECLGFWESWFRVEELKTYEITIAGIGGL